MVGHVAVPFFVPLELVTEIAAAVTELPESRLKPPFEMSAQPLALTFALVPSISNSLPVQAESSPLVFSA